MHLRRTPYEVIIEADAPELATIGQRIASLSQGQTFQLTANASDGQVPILVIQEVTQPFLARWDEQVGLLVAGSSKSLQAFAEHFQFDCEPQPGVHNHWDISVDESMIDPASLPIVVQLA
jgi:hypothetical protein